MSVELSEVKDGNQRLWSELKKARDDANEWEQRVNYRDQEIGHLRRNSDQVKMEYSVKVEQLENDLQEMSFKHSRLHEEKEENE